ncbi:FecR domain-containing protein [Crateriforma conspicua]|uniref:FecR protein n=1 Tax=Crateriforma conspicua TaxID=2527996 RepID=A0A5C5Y1P2_9PLAN|nr:FecR domain-containing protein [Crateriforma conspicua]QDV62372.1 FecR protein [Crateriforma conspicua]TWT68749.1 FecR protein [Crateriforma conspicua]
MNPDQLLHQYLLGNLDAAATAELDRLLANDADLQQRYRLAIQIDTELRNRSLQLPDSHTDDPDKAIASPATPRSPYLRTMFAMFATAVCLMIAVGLWQSSPDVVATLVSSENAAWESDLPTNPGSDLRPGTLNLKTGLATIRFGSGAELTVEAPTQVELISAMAAKLTTGAAMINVPESAIGFRLETPGGYAIDRGTKFAVRVDDNGQSTDFELIDGEIDVHHKSTGDSIRLRQAGTAASVSTDVMSLIPSAVESDSADTADNQSESDTPVPSGQRILRIGTQGRCGTAMPRSHKRHKFIDPAVLSVKRSGTGKWDFRSFFEFDVTHIDVADVVHARVRLNLIPSTRGVASRLPRINRFAIYGLTNSEKFGWDVEPTWEASPGPEDGVLLGKFEIQRSQNRGTFGIESDKLLRFLRSNADRPITLILVRETTQIEGIGVGMTHMFASDRHPESVGPTLELTVR